MIFRNFGLAVVVFCTLLSSMESLLIADEPSKKTKQVVFFAGGLLVILMMLISAATIAAEPDGIANWHNPPAVKHSFVTHQDYESVCMPGVRVGFSIYLPPNYHLGSTRYPVLYFLHGRGGTESSKSMLRLADRLDEAIRRSSLKPMILVFPSGGQHTVYCDSRDRKYLSASTLLDELIPHIDRTYRTIAAKESRAIQGMSMGGCGAFQLAFKRPDLFSSSLAYAGGFVDTTTMADIPMIHEAMFGGDPARWNLENPVELAKQISQDIKSTLKLRIVCGSKDVSLSDTQRMRASLLECRWDHDYLEYANVTHSFDELLHCEGEAGLRFAQSHFRE